VIGRLAIVLVVLAGCAAAPGGGARGPGEPPPPDEQEAGRAYDELRRLDGDLLRSDAQVTPDCQRVGQLRDNICALAVRICQIADKQPAGSAAAAQCADGKARCKNAVERAQARGCPRKE
jgi:hypothetical protein